MKSFFAAVAEVREKHTIPVSLEPDEAVWIKNGSNGSALDNTFGFGAIHGRTGQVTPFGPLEEGRLLTRAHLQSILDLKT